MLRGPSEDTGKRRGIPDGFDGGVLMLASLESVQSLGVAGLDDLDLLDFHLDIMDFLMERRKARIHARTALMHGVRISTGVVRRKTTKAHVLAMVSRVVSTARAREGGAQVDWLEEHSSPPRRC